MKIYEFIVLLKPDLTKEQIDVDVDRVRGVVEKAGGTIIKVNHWGKKKLAYEVKKHPKGYYIHFIFAVDPQAITELERTARILEDFMKFMTVKLEDKADIEAFLAKYPATVTPFAEEEEHRRPAPEGVAPAAEAGTEKEDEDSEPAGEKEADESGEPSGRESGEEE